MFISEIGEVVDTYHKLQKLDNLLDAAKNGKITITVGGQPCTSEEMIEAVCGDVVAHLRAERAEIVRFLEKKGIQE